jgi:hypothetical protein
MNYTLSCANVSQLLSVAEMANKYHFATTSAWALNALCSVTGCTLAPHKAHASGHFHPPSWCNTPILSRMIEVSTLCGYQRLCDHAVEMWVQLVLAQEVEPVEAMVIADRYGLPRLKGASYYYAVVGSGDNSDYPFAPSEHTNFPFSPAQMTSLLSGFFSLVRRWERIRETPPSFDRPEGCTYHAHGCLSTWQTVWRATAKQSAVARPKTADVLGRLRVMQELLQVDRDLRCALTPACRNAAMQSVRDLYEAEEEKLANHFEDLTLAAPRAHDTNVTG